MKPAPLARAQFPVAGGAETLLPIAFQGRELLLEAHAYQGESVGHEVIVLVHRSEHATPDSLPVVRVHSGCLTGDIFHSLRCDCYEQLQAALIAITATPFGAIVYVPYHEGRGIGLFKKIQAYAQQDRGLDTIEANIKIGAPVDSRDYTLAARALHDLGMTNINLLSNNPAKELALRALDINVVRRLPLVIPPNKFNRRYLETKRERMAHDL